ncbi:peptidylprolyl isomerase [candidate division KSB1 bacterium]|nr:peptidylprolyl isomerase [candidate division KSB1 bacterium]
MRKSCALLGALLVVLFLVSCGQKAPEPRYEPDSEQYLFFKTLSDSLGITALNPDKPVALITTSDFSVWTFDVMPGVYARFKSFKNKLADMPADQLRLTIEQNAQHEAEKKLLAAQAKAEGIAVTDSAVNAQLERYYSSRGGKESFVQFIEQQGFTLDYVEDDIRTQMSIQEYVNSYLDNNITVTDEELQSAYAEDKNATVRHILFKTQGKSDAEKEQVKQKAEEVLARAKSGEDFAALATEFTEDPGSQANGGLYESFPKGRMVKEFEDAAFDLPIGSISDLVETRYGYHIIKVIDREKETQPFDDVKMQLENQLEQTKKRETYESLLEDLKEKAKYTENFDILA